MIHVIVIMFKRGTRVIRRVYVDTFYLSGIKGQQGLEGFKVVALDYDVSKCHVCGGHKDIILQTKVLFKTENPEVDKKQTIILIYFTSRKKFKNYIQIFSINGHKSSHADFRSSDTGVTSLL
jgi:hypothetical protein